MNAWKQWRKRLEQGLERVRRKKRIVLNLGGAVLFLLLSWTRLGYPMPTAEMAYRRMERTSLLPPGEVVFSVGEHSWSFWGINQARRLAAVQTLDGTQLNFSGRWFVSRWEDRAAIALVGERSYDRFIQVFPLEEEGATMLPLYSGYGFYQEEEAFRGSHVCNFKPLALVDVPEETARAEIVLQTAQGLCVGPGWNMGNGVWFLTPDNQMLDPRLEQEWPYTMTLYRADGSVLLERSGVLEH